MVSGVCWILGGWDIEMAIKWWLEWGTLCSNKHPCLYIYMIIYTYNIYIYDYICIYNYLEDNCWECLTLYYLLAYVCMFWHQYWSVVLDHWHSILESWPFGVDRFEWSMPNLCGLIFDQLPIHHTYIYIVFYTLIYTHVHIYTYVFIHIHHEHMYCVYIYI